MMCDTHIIELEIPPNLAQTLTHLLLASKEGLVRFQGANYVQENDKGVLKLTFTKLDDGKEALAKWRDFQKEKQ